MQRLWSGSFYYGWVVAAVTFVAILVAAGIRSAPAVFIHPFEAEFGWSRAAIAAGVSVNLLLYGLAAPISGRLVDRYGPRPVMLGSLAFLSFGVAGTIFMSSLFHLALLWGVFVGLGAGGASSVMYATVASRWFVARRGLVVGFLSSANSTGQLIFLPMLMAIVVWFDWRTGSLMMAALALMMLIPIFFLMKNDPAEIGLQPYGADSAAGRLEQRTNAPPIPMFEALRTPTFWLLAGSFFVCGGTANGLVGTHLIPHAIDIGIPQVTAAATVGVLGGMNFVGTMFSGWLTDRVDPRRLLAAVYLFRGLSLFALPFMTDFYGLFIFAVVYGLDWFASVPPTVALTARRFGRQSVGTIYGWVFAAHQLGAAVSATSGGLIRDAFGDYQLAFWAGGTLALIGAGMAYMVRTQKPGPTLAPAGQAA